MTGNAKRIKCKKPTICKTIQEGRRRDASFTSGIPTRRKSARIRSERDYFSLSTSSILPLFDDVLLKRIADVQAPLPSLITELESALIISYS